MKLDSKIEVPFLNEIKSRLGVSFICCVHTFVVCFSFKESILFAFSSIIAKSCPENSYFIFTDLPAIFYFYIMTSNIAAQQNFVASLFHQAALFLVPSCKTFMTFYVKNTLKKFVYCYLFVLMLFNFAFLPSFIGFFLNMSEHYNSLSSHKLFFEANLLEFLRFYIDLYCSLMLLTAISVTVFGYLVLNFQAKSRKALYYILCLIVVVFLPPEPASQVTAFLILISVFEFMFFLSFMEHSLIKATS